MSTLTIETGGRPPWFTALSTMEYMSLITLTLSGRDGLSPAAIQALYRFATGIDGGVADFT